MKRSLREWLIRILILMIGLSIAHLGVTLFLLSELGSDPFNVLIQGLFRTLSSLTERGFLTHGRVHIAVSLLIILILLLTDRSYIKIGTVRSRKYILLMNMRVLSTNWLRTRCIPILILLMTRIISIIL